MTREEATLEKICIYTRSIERMLYTYLKCTATGNTFDSIAHERARVFSEALEAIERKEGI